MTGRRRLLIAGGALIAVLLISIGVFFALRADGPSQEAKNAQKDSLRQPTYFAVNIKGLPTYTDEIPGIQEYDLWRALWSKVNQNIDQDKDYYFGEIRGGSIQKSISESGVPVVTFMVDIPDEKRSFKITIDGSEEAGYYSTYITCPSDADLIYPKVACKEEGG